MKDFRKAAEQEPGSIVVCEEIEERDDWLAIAYRDIRASDCVVLILTSNSAVSPNCEAEVSFATSLGKRVLTWTPVTGLLAPKWVNCTERLSDDAIDAIRAVVELSARLGALP